MLRASLCTATFVISLILSAPTFAGQDASATLPLDDLIKLYDNRDAKENAKHIPPVPAALQSVAFEGRLLEDGVELDAQCDVEVLESKDWVRVALFPLRDGIQVSRLPDLERGVFVAEGGTLFFTVRGAGRYRFSLGLRFAAERQAKLRRVEIDRGSAPAVSLRLEYDEDLFKLSSKVASRDARGTTLLPDKQGFALEWEQRAGAVVVASTPRPATPARVAALHASSIATLEGERITRLLYRLRFAGSERIEFKLPVGERLVRVYQNGIAIPVEAKQRNVALELAPARVGGEDGTVELVLASESLDGFNLDGELHFAFPECSWPTREFFLDTHLPTVFNYTWRGGSLAPSEGTPKANWSYGLPTPGTTLHFHQVLVSSSAPDLELDYAVDLEGHYYRAQHY